MNHKEKRGIYNVSFNEKKATPINSELEAIENAIIEYVIHYVKGWHNIKRDKGRGAEHIKLHLQQGSEGEITIEELLNLGKSIREYLKIFKEPFLEDENKSGRVYEWQDKNGIRFRVATDINREEGLIPPLSPSDEIIISFYSDRNLNQKMQFKNPKVEAYYSTQLDKTQETQEENNGYQNNGAYNNQSNNGNVQNAENNNGGKNPNKQQKPSPFIKYKIIFI